MKKSMFNEIIEKANQLRNEAMKLYEQKMDEKLILNKEDSKHLLEELASKLDALFYDYHLDLVGIWNRWHSETGFDVFEVNAESVCRKHMLDVVETVTRKQMHHLFLDKTYRIFEEFEHILNDIIEELEKEEPIEEETVEDSYSDCDYTDTVTVKVIEQKKDRLSDLLDNISKYVEAYAEAVKNGKDDLMEEDIRYKDTDSVIDPTEAEILRQGKLPFEEEYDKEEKYYLIAKPLSVGKAHLYGCELVADYEIRKNKLTMDEQIQGSYLVYMGTYDDCVKCFNDHSEQVLPHTKIYFRCTGAKTFKGRG